MDNNKKNNYNGYNKKTIYTTYNICCNSYLVFTDIPIYV